MLSERQTLDALLESEANIARPSIELRTAVRKYFSSFAPESIETEPLKKIEKVSAVAQKAVWSDRNFFRELTEKAYSYIFLGVGRVRKAKKTAKEESAETILINYFEDIEFHLLAHAGCFAGVLFSQTHNPAFGEKWFDHFNDSAAMAEKTNSAFAVWAYLRAGDACKAIAGCKKSKEEKLEWNENVYSCYESVVELNKKHDLQHLAFSYFLLGQAAKNCFNQVFSPPGLRITREEIEWGKKTYSALEKSAKAYSAIPVKKRKPIDSIRLLVSLKEAGDIAYALFFKTGRNNQWGKKVRSNYKRIMDNPFLDSAEGKKLNYDLAYLQRKIKHLRL